VVSIAFHEEINGAKLAFNSLGHLITQGASVASTDARNELAFLAQGRPQLQKKTRRGSDLGRIDRSPRTHRIQS
jgi:hypothetical protein